MWFLKYKYYFCNIMVIILMIEITYSTEYPNLIRFNDIKYDVNLE